ncbi:MAG: methyltransferase domain-containing protein [Hyphomonadaceae bacterium]|nr:methyltransferase domain-containing protein [Hyphomonadaceae bacterium]
MRQDSVSIERFYASALGRAAAWALASRVTDLWQSVDQMNLLGLGYPLPLLESFADGAKAVAAAFPDTTGHVRWDGTGRGNCTLSAPEARLPFPDGVFDRALVLHALEEAENPRAVCRDLWRVMAPEGRIVVAVANRRGLWARAERTPFGHGRPWTLRQLSGLLSDCAFQVTASTHTLFMPPIPLSLVTAGVHGWERAGRWVAPGLGGVVLVEAVKRLYIEPGGGAVATVGSPAKSPARASGVPQRQAELEHLQ